MSTTTPDLRSLLRTELASRRINDPHAIYSPTGVLSCSVCHQQLKSQSAWEAHTRSPQHLTRLHALEKQNGQGARKKRKAGGDDEGEEEEGGKTGHTDGQSQERKRKKVDGDVVVPGDFFGDDVQPSDGDDDDGTRPPPATSNPNKTSPPPPQSDPQINETEWAAFEADIASTVRSAAVLTAPSTISAPAMPAGHNNDDPASTDRPGREAADEAADAEREEAARRLEEEFDTMHDLEERVRRLRGRREELRVGIQGVVGEGGDGKDMAGGDDDGDEDEDGSEEVDEWDDWRFGHVTR